MEHIQYPDHWDRADSLLVADALVRYARWDCEDDSDREQRAIELAHEVAAGAGLTLDEALARL